MPEQKRIPCPYCGTSLCYGCSWELRERQVKPDPACPDCIKSCMCKGSHTITDRRAPTAADRAVERIKAECTDFIGHSPVETAFDNGMVEACDCMLQIINEEVARG